MTRTLTIGYIIQRVAEYHGTTAELLRSDRKCRRFSRPRHIAMWLAAELLGVSTGVIGRQFGARDPSSVAAAIRGIDRLRRSDLALASVTDALREAIAIETAEPPSERELATLAGAELARSLAVLIGRVVHDNPGLALETFQRWHGELREMAP